MCCWRDAATAGGKKQETLRESREVWGGCCGVSLGQGLSPAPRGIAALPPQSQGQHGGALAHPAPHGSQRCRLSRSPTPPICRGRCWQEAPRPRSARPGPAAALTPPPSSCRLRGAGGDKPGPARAVGPASSPRGHAVPHAWVRPGVPRGARSPRPGLHCVPPSCACE